METIACTRNIFYTCNPLLVPKGKREHVSYDTITPPMKANLTITIKGIVRPLMPFNETLHNRGFCMAVKRLNSTDKHLESLNSYLVKLDDDDAKQHIAKKLNQSTLKTKKVVRVLDNYIDSDVKSKNVISSANDDRGSQGERSLKNYVELKLEDAEGKEKSADDASDLYLIGVLVSINIAVFLFEIATPVKNSGFELFSLPMVYGAKINNLILTGEWWRLVTPIFLHSGIVHIALGSWVLFTFGLEVSREYGAFTFLLIYILGGISGNLFSFLHTPDPTVGGTGPAFAIIGAWLIYQALNKDYIAKDTSGRLFQNAIITTAISFALSRFGPIDDWAHFAAVITGIAYGFLTCSSLQVKDASSDERMLLVRRYVDPCKSVMYFSIFLSLLCFLLFVVEPPLDMM